MRKFWHYASLKLDLNYIGTSIYDILAQSILAYENLNSIKTAKVSAKQNIQQSSLLPWFYRSFSSRCTFYNIDYPWDNKNVGQ